jgi:hypothetical protein
VTSQEGRSSKELVTNVTIVNCRLLRWAGRAAAMGSQSMQDLAGEICRLEWA